MGEVISFGAFKAKKNPEANPNYVQKIRQMDMLELLEEMVAFQEERSRVGHLTVEMCVSGQVLFKALEDGANTNELRLLTRSYRRYLEAEYQRMTGNASK